MPGRGLREEAPTRGGAVAERGERRGRGPADARSRKGTGPRTTDRTRRHPRFSASTRWGSRESSRVAGGGAGVCRGNQRRGMGGEGVR
ncbi:hypothetical protein GQ55_7G222100 [Panicum hallii var. hallii]|uniref:Uncharacterized protein n=1 Tax=Panicum hallii var. hallii TaxID=1504633 RepID=A0A2T7CXR8_9POAL|nr:hypothetical protein GQ55_7G222100 [Panicum hallii var. hallii]